MRKLIISYDPYDWFIHCFSLIKNEPKRCDIIVIDTKTPMFYHRDMCEDATIIQRRFDLQFLGNKLKVVKLFSLSMDNIEKFIAQLQLQIMLSGVKEVYCQTKDNFTIIVKSICDKLNVSLFRFGDKYCVDIDEIVKRKKEFHLSDEEFEEKNRLLKQVAGIDRKISDNPFTDRIEKFH